MGWVFLEIVIALAIAIVIVWWTFPRKAGGAEKREAEKPSGKEEP